MTGVARIALWVMSTVTVLVLLFSYSTSTSSHLAAGSTRELKVQHVLP